MTTKHLEALAHTYVANISNREITNVIGYEINAQPVIVRRMFWAAVELINEQLAAAN